MQLVLRMNRTSIRMNNWVIFFHFEMIGIKFALKLSQMCGTGCPKSKVTISNCDNITVDRHNFIIDISLEPQ